MVELSNIQARILRYLVRQGGSHDVCEIRIEGQLGNISSERLFGALRALVDAGTVMLSYRTEARLVFGFRDEVTYPVFWVLHYSRIGGDA